LFSCSVRDSLFEATSFIADFAVASALAFEQLSPTALEAGADELGLPLHTCYAVLFSSGTIAFGFGF
jgi:hypothetical protein